MENGDPAGYFEGKDTWGSGNEVLEDSNGNTNMNLDKEKEEIDDSNSRPTEGWAKDIALMRNQGLEVEDDYTPAPENVTTISSLERSNLTILNPGQSSGRDGINYLEIVLSTNKIQPSKMIGHYLKHQT